MHAKAAPVVLVLLLVSCGPKYDIKTNPVGAIAFSAARIEQSVGKVQRIVAAAETAGILPTDKARVVMKASVTISEQGLNLADALEQLDKLPLTDIGRMPLLEKVKTILAVINIALFEMVAPITDDLTRGNVVAELQQINSELLKVGAR